MGPIETSEWEDLLNNVQNRLDALERNHRKLAQDSAKTNEAAGEMMKVATAIDKDYPAYKNYVEQRFKSFGEIMEAEIVKVNDKITVADNNFTAADNRFGMNEERIHSLQRDLDSLTNYWRRKSRSW